MSLRESLQLRIQQQTKPPGSLGVLEDVGLRLGLIQSSLTPVLRKPAVCVFAASHGVAVEGVSAYPAAVTAEMVRNFLHGGAAVCVLARSVGATLHVVDVGVDADEHAAWRGMPGLHSHPVARGTESFLRGPAMTPSQCDAALATGRHMLHALSEAGHDIVALGEMGIGNSTSAAALCAALLEVDVERVTGRGTGVDEAGLRRKHVVIRESLVVHRADAPVRSTAPAAHAQHWLQRVGGFEIAALTGAILAACEVGTPLVVDGFIVSCAALVASRIDPRCLEFCFFAHRSAEFGHGLVLEHLQATPLLSLGMRLGEGSGAVLALPILQAAARLVSEMATFESAGISPALPDETAVPSRFVADAGSA